MLVQVLQTLGYVKETERYILTRCIYCGDSRKHKNKGHFYIYKNTKLCYCVRCGKKLHLTKFLIDLKRNNIVDIQTYRELYRNNDLSTSPYYRIKLNQILDKSKSVYHTDVYRIRLFLLERMLYHWEQYMASIDKPLDCYKIVPDVVKYLAKRTLYDYAEVDPLYLYNVTQWCIVHIDDVFTVLKSMSHTKKYLSYLQHKQKETFEQFVFVLLTDPIYMTIRMFSDKTYLHVPLYDISNENINSNTLLNVVNRVKIYYIAHDTVLDNVLLLNPLVLSEQRKKTIFVAEGPFDICNAVNYYLYWQEIVDDPYISIERKNRFVDTALYVGSNTLMILEQIIRDKTLQQNMQWHFFCDQDAVESHLELYRKYRPKNVTLYYNSKSKDVGDVSDEIQLVKLTG